MKAAIYNHTCWIEETDPTSLKAHMNKLLIQCDYKIIGFIEHFFTPNGYTAVWLLSESHLAIHTFPEENKTYLELSSCNQEKNEQFQKLTSSNPLCFSNPIND